MFLPLTVALFAVLGALAAYAGVLTVRGRAIDNPLFFLGVAGEVVLVAQLVAGVADLGNAGPHMSKAVFIAYLIGLICVLPVAGFWALAERESRWGTGVLLIATLGLLVMIVRLVQLWNGS